MNERIKEIATEVGISVEYLNNTKQWSLIERFAELLMQDMHRKVIASILITDVVITEKGQKPTSEDYIRAINHDFGVD